MVIKGKQVPMSDIGVNNSVKIGDYIIEESAESASKPYYHCPADVFEAKYAVPEDKKPTSDTKTTKAKKDES